MNRVETEYAKHLRQLQIIGQIEWFVYEGIKLRLADRTFFTPDFFVMLANGELEVHEVKGTKYVEGVGRPWIEEDANVKLKVCTELFPFPLRLMFYDKHRGWIDAHATAGTS